MQAKALPVLVLALLVSACGQPGPMASFQPGESGRVVRIIDGDAVVLDTGQSVRLVGLEAPSEGRNGAPGDAHAEQSARVLEDLILGREVQLYYAGLTRDRYDRALAHLYTRDALGPAIWVNLELVARGGARVRTYPDTATGSEPLFAAEADARAAQRGLWALADYRVQDARDARELGTGFVILEAILDARGPAPFDDSACARRLLGSDLTLVVERAAAMACDVPAGTRVEVRGWLRGARLTLNSSANLRPRPVGPVAMTADPR